MMLRASPDLYEEVLLTMTKGTIVLLIFAILFTFVAGAAAIFSVSLATGSAELMEEPTEEKTAEEEAGENAANAIALIFMLPLLLIGAAASTVASIVGISLSAPLARRHGAAKGFGIVLLILNILFLITGILSVVLILA